MFTQFGFRYKSIFDNECRQIIVLEDIPGAFLKHPEEFHHCLKKYRNFGRPSLYKPYTLRNVNLMTERAIQFLRAIALMHLLLTTDNTCERCS